MPTTGKPTLERKHGLPQDEASRGQPPTRQWDRLSARIHIHHMDPPILDDPLNIDDTPLHMRSEEHTSELQSLMRISYAVFCLKKKKKSEITYKISILKHTVCLIHKTT